MIDYNDGSFQFIKSFFFFGNFGNRLYYIILIKIETERAKCQGLLGLIGCLLFRKFEFNRRRKLDKFHGEQ